MISYLCDWCGKKIKPSDLMPRGGGASYGGELGMHVSVALPDGRRAHVAVGPVGVGRRWNENHWHKTCVQDMVANGWVVNPGELGAAS